MGHFYTPKELIARTYIEKHKFLSTENEHYVLEEPHTHSKGEGEGRGISYGPVKIKYVRVLHWFKAGINH